jgi:hypothetical protein
VSETSWEMGSPVSLDSVSSALCKDFEIGTSII